MREGQLWRMMSRMRLQCCTAPNAIIGMLSALAVIWLTIRSVPSRRMTAALGTTLTKPGGMVPSVAS